MFSPTTLDYPKSSKNLFHMNLSSFQEERHTTFLEPEGDFYWAH